MRSLEQQESAIRLLCIAGAEHGHQTNGPGREAHMVQAAAKSFVKSMHGVRYQVKDMARAIAFYTNHLGFRLERQQLPGA